MTVNEVFGTIVNMSIAASFLIAVCLVVRKFFKHMPKYIRCLMWILVAVRLAVPFTIESPVSLLPAKEYVPQETVVKESGNTETTQSANIIVVNNKAADASAEVPITADTKETTNGFEPDLLSVLSIIWMLGFAAVFIYAFISYLRLRSCVKGALQVGRRVYEVKGLDSAFVLGIVNPRIYIPEGLTRDEAFIILSHERAHIKRLDHLVKPVTFFIAAVHWFNPFAWVFYYFLSEDIELACDEKALKTIGYDKKKLYSTTLLNMSVPRKYIAACPVAFGETGTKERIRNVLKMKKNRTIAALAAFAVCAALTAGFLTYPEQAAADESEAATEETVLEGSEANPVYVDTGINEEEPLPEETAALDEEDTAAPEYAEINAPEGVAVHVAEEAEEPIYEDESADENAEAYAVADDYGNVETVVYEEGIWPVAAEESFVTRTNSDDHVGIDIAAEEGSPVVATADGTVITAANDTQFGNYVVISGDDGNVYSFRHLKVFTVSEGDAVSAGETIGTIGSTGNSTGVHLHYAVFDASGNYVGF